jgi:hypothetical protein
MADLIRLLVKWPPRRADAEAVLASVKPPCDPWITTVRDAWKEQCAQIGSHSDRTWAYGRALALLDRAVVDEHLFYVACLLHDHGLEHPRQGEDFTLRSADRAMRCVRAIGRSEADALAVADAITLHVTPGLRRGRDPAMGVYLQAGSLLDLAGARAWELPGAYRNGVAVSRKGVTDSFVRMVRAEARVNPGSRFHLLRRCGMTLGFRLNPMRYTDKVR